MVAMSKRQAFVEQAIVEMTGGSDPQAVGAAVTVELCGHWDHDGSCEWPHHTSISKQDEGVKLRTIFACNPEQEAEVRRRVVAGMTAGKLEGSPKGPSSWTIVSVGTDNVLASEQELAGRLTGQ
jgi:hypothetical protein